MSRNSQLYIGLMSGTSVDGVDIAIVDFAGSRPNIVHAETFPYDTETSQRIHSLCRSGEEEIDRLGPLDHDLGLIFGNAVNSTLKRLKLYSTDIAAIGSHGQTIRHRPNQTSPFTLQIGDPNVLAIHTNIDVIADFRKKDVALGGQGAPLVPAFHHAMFKSRNANRAIVNIGGIANITWIPNTLSIDDVIGFDTGPGNRLMDAWCFRHTGKLYDEDGQWAGSGKIHQQLLSNLLSHPFLNKPYPKSTGREEFNLAWLDSVLDGLAEKLLTVDVQRTLLEYTVITIQQHLHMFSHLNEVYICGGGACNGLLMSRLQDSMGPILIQPTDKLGISADSVEASAFAWLAFAYQNNIPSNVPSVTGASRSAVLGGKYLAQ